jgi:hypothetical protein
MRRMANDSSAPRSHEEAGGAGSMRTRGFRGIEIPLALLVGVFALIAAVRAGATPSCIDFYQFWAVGRAVGKHQARDVYTDVERKHLGGLYWSEALNAQAHSQTPDVPTKRIVAAQERQVFETYSTPWMYTLFGIAASDDYDRDQDHFQAFATIAYAIGIAALAHLLGYRPLAIAACAWFFVSTWFKPFGDEVIAGNVNRLQVALLALFAWVHASKRWSARDVAAGVVLGVAILFKPNLALVAVVLALGYGIAGRFRELARIALGVAIGALAAFAISSAYFGTARAWSDWIGTIPELLSQGSTAGGNYALSRLVFDKSGLSLSRVLPFAMLALVALALLVARKRTSAVTNANDDTAMNAPSDAALSAQDEAARTNDTELARESARERAGFDVALVGLGATISVLATDLVWLHYYVLCVPLALFALRSARCARTVRSRWTLFAAALTGVLLVGLQLFLKILDIPRPSTASPYVNAGALLLCAVALVELASRMRIPPRSAGVR